MANRSFATFLLDDQLFGVDILLVREINRQLDITAVPHSQHYVRGMVNLRGQIVTILDLKHRLGLPESELGGKCCNIILKTETEMDVLRRNEEDCDDLSASADKVGLLVDEIQDVVTIADEALEKPPANVGKIDGQFLSGVIKLDSQLIAVLSLDKVLNHSDN